MRVKVLLALLLGAIASQVLASDFGVPGLIQGQLTPEERNWLRERWRLASPEERQALWRQFQGMMPTPPWPGPADLAGAAGFGTGFEQRARSTQEDDAPPARDGWFGH